MTAETRTAEAILQALIMMRSSMRLSLTSPDPLWTMNTSSPRTDSPISTLCVYTITQELHLSPPTFLPLTTTHCNLPTPPSPLPTAPNFQVCTISLRVWLVLSSLSPPPPQSLPCLCVGEFGKLHFTELQAQARSDAPRKFRVRVAGEHLYVRHGGKEA